MHPLPLRTEQTEELRGPLPADPNQCGTRVSNSAASPAVSTTSCSPSTRRSFPDSTYNHS